MDKIDILETDNAKVYFKNSTNMSELEDGSVNLIITSPPYWTLKDYENQDQIGLGSSSYDFYIN